MVTRTRLNFTLWLHCLVGLDSTVGIATRYLSDGPGIASRRGQVSTPVQTDPGAHPTSRTMETGSFSRLMWPGRRADHPHHLAPRLKKSIVIPLHRNWALLCWTLLLPLTYFGCLLPLGLPNCILTCIEICLKFFNSEIFVLMISFLMFCLILSTHLLLKSSLSVYESHKYLMHLIFIFMTYRELPSVIKISVPLQAWSGPESSRKLRFQDYMTTAQDGGKFVSPTHRPPLPLTNTPGTYSC